MTSKKITKFNEIPRFTRTGSWECCFDLFSFIKHIDNEIQEFGLQLNPDFQRGHVWTEEQQIAFVEYFLRGGNSGTVVYFNNPSWNNKATTDYNDYVCVDGLQRITAIRRFIDNEIRVFGSYFNEFTDKLRTQLFVMRINVNDLQTKKEVLQWYVDMNTGGTPHSEEEVARVKAMIEADSQKRILLKSEENKMDIKTIFGVAKEEKIKVAPYGHGTYELCYLKLDNKGTYDLLGFDAPIDDDPEWRFWVESGDEDGAAETNKVDITDEEKEYIKLLYFEFVNDNFINS